MSIFTAVADYFAALGNRWIVLAAIMLISYLLGSFNTSIVVSKAFLKKDIRDYGSHNAGFTNAVRSMGIKLALLVMAGDVAKCALACVIGQLLYCGNMNFIDGTAGRLLAGAFVFLGHIYPVYFRFRGGKGALTFGITVLFYDWRIFLIGLAVFLIVVLISKYISLGSLVIALIFPVSVILQARTSISAVTMSWGYVIVATGMGALLIWKHRSNIVRLVKGTESKFSFHSKPLIDGAENVDLLKKK